MKHHRRLTHLAIETMNIYQGCSIPGETSSIASPGVPKASKRMQRGCN